MWTLQSTSTHKGPRGHVFSPCLKWKEPIHHWLFVTETETTVTICVCVFECARLDVSIHALITHVNMCLYVCVCVCVICTSDVQRRQAARIVLFQQANTMTVASTACTALINLASLPCTVLKNPHKCSNKYAHFHCACDE